MNVIEQDAVAVVRDFIVAAVGEDMGPGMTKQAEELVADLAPILNRAWIAGGVAFAYDQDLTAPDLEPFLRDVLAKHAPFGTERSDVDR